MLVVPLLLAAATHAALHLVRLRVCVLPPVRSSTSDRGMSAVRLSTGRCSLACRLLVPVALGKAISVLAFPVLWSNSVRVRYAPGRWRGLNGIHSLLPAIATQGLCWSGQVWRDDVFALANHTNLYYIKCSA